MISLGNFGYYTCIQVTFVGLKATFLGRYSSAEDSELSLVLPKTVGQSLYMSDF